MKENYAPAQNTVNTIKHKTIRLTGEILIANAHNDDRDGLGGCSDDGGLRLLHVVHAAVGDDQQDGVRLLLLTIFHAEYTIMKNTEK